MFRPAPCHNLLTYSKLVLSLFGLGWSDGLDHFSPAGELYTRWEQACQSAVPR